MMSRFSRCRTISRTVVRRMLTLGAICVTCTLAATAQPSNSIKLMKGIVSDTRTGKPVDGGKIFVYQGASAEPIAQSRINPSTGAFQVVLGPSTDYRFVLRSLRYLPSEARVRTPAGTTYEEVVHNLSMEPIPVGRTLFSGRLFDANATKLKSSAELASAIAFLKESPAATVQITVLPDAAAAKAAAKAPAKGKKKGKKGATAAAAEPTAAATGSGDNALATLAQSRMQAVKSLMQKEGISLTRIKWEVPTTSGELKAFAGRKENVVITVNGVDVDEVEEEDS